ncbi:cysteine protease StiP domain-containing protein [Yoonia sp. 2307UL14-13]|uniref:cysteine protease StiP domain-containing protein n=1 Tax=Yoonia sp. 2307UL14-13 TaxID=3126506 RepID=UPI0030AFA1DA
MIFSGSYDPDDVTLLLQPIDMALTDVAEKERLIQSGALHYSEILAPEHPPSADYMAIYEQALVANGQRMADAVVSLAKGLAQQIDGDIVLVSLARAGLPVGVLLKRALIRMGRDCHHYGISIIRDRGLDAVAMKHILARHPARSVVFVDGWTGKGAIAGELTKAAPACGIPTPRLATLGDIGGFAWMAPTDEDWLIPSGILGGVISGLVSRTLLNEAIKTNGGYHGCSTLDHLAGHDVSRDFVDKITALFDFSKPTCQPLGDRTRHLRRTRVDRTIAALRDKHGITNLNRIKPSLAEATRAVLRRRPHMVYVASTSSTDTAPLMHLIRERDIPFVIAPDLIPGYRAVTIIEKTS